MDAFDRQSQSSQEEQVSTSARRLFLRIVNLLSWQEHIVVETWDTLASRFHGITLDGFFFFTQAKIKVLPVCMYCTPKA
jgi:hypothetical protein